MTEDEWESVAVVIENGFKGEFDDVKSTAYKVFLLPFDAGAVLAALRKLVEGGQIWTPTPGEIRVAMKAMEQPPLPSWPEVWQMIQRALSRGGRVAGADWRRKQDAATAWLREHEQPVIAAFVEAETYERLALTEFFDPDYGQLRVKELRERWEQFVGVAQERLDRGLALEGMSGRRAVGPGRLDATALLDAIRPKQQRELPSGNPPE